jgi:hypothetical protein
MLLDFMTPQGSASGHSGSGIISLLIMMAILIFIVYLIVRATNKRTARLRDNPIDNNQKRKSENSLGISKFIKSGKYLSGHPSIINPINNSQIACNETDLMLFNSRSWQPMGIIPLKDITNISLEDASTIEKRVTATRLLTVGIFAFAAKKKKVTSLYYISIEWLSGKFKTETIFEFDGKDALINANKCKSYIMECANKV